MCLVFFYWFRNVQIIMLMTTRGKRQKSSHFASLSEHHNARVEMKVMSVRSLRGEQLCAVEDALRANMALMDAVHSPL